MEHLRAGGELRPQEPGARRLVRPRRPRSRRRSSGRWGSARRRSETPSAYVDAGASHLIVMLGHPYDLAERRAAPRRTRLTGNTLPAVSSTEDDAGIGDELQAWLERNWDPDLAVSEWWERVGDAGWTAPHFPLEWGGRGYTRRAQVTAYRRVPRLRRGAAPQRSRDDDGRAHDPHPRDARADRAARDARCTTGAGRGASCSASRAPGPTSPASRPVPPATGTAG